MGRKKIVISRIGDERSRQITFSKRKHGLLKKAYELSVLCDVEVALIVIGNNQKLYQYASSNINEILMKYTEIQEPYESKTNADVHEDISKRETRQGGQRESPDEDGDEYGESFPPSSVQFVSQTRHVGAVPSPGATIANPGMPVAMPVAVPVPSSSSPKHSGSGSDASSLSPSSVTETPNVGKVVMGMPLGMGMAMPPPKLPPRLQTIRSSQLKLHLPGGGTVKLPSADASKARPSTVGEALAEVSSDGSDKRPKLSVVTPGMKEYSPRTNLPSSMLSPSILSTLLSSGQGQMDAAGNLTIPFPFDPMATPGLNLSTPGLANLFQDMNVPSASAGGEALITFPINFQNLQTTQSGGVKFGPPILVTPQPSMVEAPPTFPTSVMTSQSSVDDKVGEAPDSGLSMFKRQQSLEMVQQIMQLYMQHQNAMPPSSQGGVVLSPSEMEADSDGSPQSKRRCPTPPEGNSLAV